VGEAADATPTTPRHRAQDLQDLDGGDER